MRVRADFPVFPIEIIKRALSQAIFFTSDDDKRMSILSKKELLMSNYNWDTMPRITSTASVMIPFASPVANP